MKQKRKEDKAQAQRPSVFRREWETAQSTYRQYNDTYLKKREEQEALVRDIHQLEAELAHLSSSNQQLMADLNRQLMDNGLLFLSEYRRRHAYYSVILNEPQGGRGLDINRILVERSDRRGIVVYPPAVPWEPQQRPQHLLKAFAEAGYLCFFCDSGINEAIVEIEPNVLLIKYEHELLCCLQSQHVLVLNTWLMQNAWIDHLPHKTLWYDILDRVDFLSSYDKQMLLKHYEVLCEADLVTYSARRLADFCRNRPDIVYLPNAGTPSDFQTDGEEGRSDDLSPFDDLNEILLNRRRIIGYFGAIEEWFDRDLVTGLAEEEAVDIVLIGHCGIQWADRPDNVHLLGQKPYGELKHYAAWFDALILPFVVNDLTNCVSPVKFFEYCCLEKPIISTPIAEVLPFAGDGITIVSHSRELTLDEGFWRLSDRARRHLRHIAGANQWSSRFEAVESWLTSSVSGLRLYANRTYGRHISVFTGTFLNFRGDHFYSGGAERYLIDLHEICGELGYQLDIYQYGDFPWYRKYDDINVYSLGDGTLNMKEFSLEALKGFGNRFMHTVNGRFALHLYSSFFQAYPHAAHPSIGISHGVAWDHPQCNFTDGSQFWTANERYITGAQNVQRLVSVDTNTANWFQTVAYDVSMKMTIIPNYVDLNTFKPATREEGRLRIVYPRRLYRARGLYITLDVVDELLEAYPHIEFHFVGKGFPEDVAHVEQKQKRWPERVFCYHRDPEDMHEVYQLADIALIPTLHSEGTSLSCLEACASGCVVISTRVGGLSDLIINEYNGLLIQPQAKALKEALVRCIEDAQLRDKLSRNAASVAAAFGKDMWKREWKQQLLEALGEVRDCVEDAGPAGRKSRTLLLSCETMEPDAASVLKLAYEQLAAGDSVFIRSANEAMRQHSFGRLQWITPDDELYFIPDETRTI